MPIIVRLSVEHLRHEIVAALSPEALSADIKLAVDRAIQEFDFDAELRRIIDTTLREALTSAARSAMFDFVRADDVRQLFVERMKAALER